MYLYLQDIIRNKFVIDILKMMKGIQHEQQNHVVIKNETRQIYCFPLFTSRILYISFRLIVNVETVFFLCGVPENP